MPPGEAMLVPQPLEDPLRRMLLLLGPAFVLFKNAVDDRNKRVQLRPAPAASAADSQAGPRTSTSSRPFSGRSQTAAPPLARLIPRSEPHGGPENKAPRCFIPRPRQKRQRAAQVPDFYSGATDRLGRFTEGFLLRRLHEVVGMSKQPESRRPGEGKNVGAPQAKPDFSQPLHALRVREGCEITRITAPTEEPTRKSGITPAATIARSMPT